MAEYIYQVLRVVDDEDGEDQLIPVVDEREEEIVRCEDCQYSYTTDNRQLYHCRKHAQWNDVEGCFHNALTSPNWYCA